MAIHNIKPLTAAEFEKINDQIANKEKSVETLQTEIEELKGKAKEYVTDLMKRYGIDAKGAKKSAAAGTTNKSADVKAAIAAFMKNKKTVSKSDLADHVKSKLGLKSFLIHHYKDTVKEDKEGNVTLVA